MYVVFMDRKPGGEGLRIFLRCFKLSNSTRSICYNVLHDITIPHPGGPHIVEQIEAQRPPNATGITLCADSYFTSFGWMESNLDKPAVFSFSKTRLDSVADLFSHDLNHHQYRVFKKGEVLLSIWADNKVMMCASTAHTNTPANQGHLRGHVIAPLVPLISQQGVAVLQQLSGDDLHALCSRMGVSAGQNDFLIWRIFLIFQLTTKNPIRWIKT
jgi:hypothetical protein